MKIRWPRKCHKCISHTLAEAQLWQQVFNVKRSKRVYIVHKQSEWLLRVEGLLIITDVRTCRCCRVPIRKLPGSAQVMCEATLMASWEFSFSRLFDRWSTGTTIYTRNAKHYAFQTRTSLTAR